MKPRIKLTDPQLKRVADMRSAGHSWSAIGRVLGVNRQVVKREYLEWEGLRNSPELESVRRDATAEEFARHIEILLGLAQELSEQLERVVARPGMDLAAEDVFVPVLDLEKPVMGVETGDPASRHRGTWRRRRHWLFEALEEHLLGTGWSATLRGWTDQHRERSRLFKSMEQKAFYKIQERLGELVGTRNGKAQPVENIAAEAAAVAWAVIKDAQERMGWESLLGDRWDEVADAFRESAKSVEVVEQGGQRALQMPGRQRPLPISSGRHARAISDACRQGLEDFLSSLDQETRQVAVVVNNLEQCLETLLKQLDPLSLRPLLLRTRCSLCPT